MELRHLRYFLAVAEELNFTRAAERLGISQPPLTQQVKALEAELGVTLLDRSAYRIELTDAGRIFAAEAARILGDARSAMQAARRAATGVTGRVRVGFTESASFNSLVTSTLRTYRSDFPGRRGIPRRASVDGSHCGAARGADRCRLRAAASADPARTDARSAGEGAAARGRAQRPSAGRPAGGRSRLARRGDLHPLSPRGAAGSGGYGRRRVRDRGVHAQSRPVRAAALLDHQSGRGVAWHLDRSRQHALPAGARGDLRAAARRAPACAARHRLPHGRGLGGGAQLHRCGAARQESCRRQLSASGRA